MSIVQKYTSKRTTSLFVTFGDFVCLCFMRKLSAFHVLKNLVGLLLLAGLVYVVTISCAGTSEPFLPRGWKGLVWLDSIPNAISLLRIQAEFTDSIPEHHDYIGMFEFDSLKFHV